MPELRQVARPDIARPDSRLASSWGLPTWHCAIFARLCLTLFDPVSFRTRSRLLLLALPDGSTATQEKGREDEE
jgi:hypothetical protein